MITYYLTLGKKGIGFRVSHHNPYITVFLLRIKKIDTMALDALYSHGMLYLKQTSV